MKEREIELQVGYWLKAKGIFFYKSIQGGFFDPLKKKFRRQQSPFFRLGVPDFVCIHKGRYIGLEIKSRIGRQSEHQKIFEADCVDAGGLYYLIRSLDDLKQIDFT